MVDKFLVEKINIFGAFLQRKLRIPRFWIISTFTTSTLIAYLVSSYINLTHVDYFKLSWYGQLLDTLSPVCAALVMSLNHKNQYPYGRKTSYETVMYKVCRYILSDYLLRTLMVFLAILGLGIAGLNRLIEPIEPTNTISLLAVSLFTVTMYVFTMLPVNPPPKKRKEENLLFDAIPQT